jgi:nucleotidyltransferase AbiEii toxin of type IV toxin-antitoxin system
MFERFLERLSKSKYKNNFILKGGMLIAAIVGVDNRSTMDMDATIKNYPISIDSLTEAIT